MALLATSASASGGGGIGSLLILALPLLLIVYLIYSQRRRQKQMSKMQAELQPGDAVITTTGLHGRLVSEDGDACQVEIADGVIVTWERRALVRRPQPAARAEDDADPNTDTDTDKSE